MEAPSRPDVAPGFCFPAGHATAPSAPATIRPAYEWRVRPIRLWYPVRSPEFPTRVVLHGKVIRAFCEAFPLVAARRGRSHRLPRAGPMSVRCSAASSKLLVDPRTIAPNQTRQRRREEERDKFSFGRAGSVRPTEFPLLESAIVRHTFRRTFSMRTRTLLPRGSRSEQQRENSCREAPVNL